MKSVAEVCQETGLTRKTLFYYDRIGLLSPLCRNGRTKAKMYSQADMDRLKNIIRYRKCGVSLDDIRRILDDPKCDAEAVIKQTIIHLQKQKELLEEEIDHASRLLQEKKRLS